MERPNISLSETRNSPVRRYTQRPIFEITKTLHERFPNLRPNHITAAGGITTLTLSALAAKYQLNKSLLFTGLTFSNLTDAFDGPLARLMKYEDPESINTSKGAVFDAASDRIQEFSMAMSRAVQAQKKQDKTAARAALLSAATNPLPSVTKAFAETKGVAVPEGGTGIFGFISTRVGRAAVQITATAFPDAVGGNYQKYTDALLAGANVLTSIERIKSSFRNTPTLSHETRDEAKKRLVVLSTISTGVLIATAATSKKLSAR